MRGDLRYVTLPLMTAHLAAWGLRRHSYYIAESGPRQPGQEQWWIKDDDEQYGGAGVQLDE